MAERSSHALRSVTNVLWGLQTVAFALAAAGFYATAKWNAGVPLAVCAYLGSLFVFRFLKRGTYRGARLSATQVSRLTALAYLTFVLCIVGGLWGLLVNWALFRSGVVPGTQFWWINGCFAALAIEVLAGKFAFAGRSTGVEPETGPPM